MNSVEIVKLLCKEKQIPISRLERDLGYSNGYIGQLRKGVFPTNRLVEIANYLAVSVDYLLGTGPRTSPISPSMNIFEVMREQKRSLDEISQLTGIPVETIRSFALGGKVENGRKCLDEIAEKLKTNPAYLMGWTSNKEDELPYLKITAALWEESGNDPAAAHDLQQFAEEEEYEERMADTHRAVAIFRYLEGMGFTVSGSILKSHYEDMIDEAGHVIRQDEIADEFGTVLSRDGLTATFTDAEFEELQAIIKEVIEGRFYKKVLKQQKK